MKDQRNSYLCKKCLGIVVTIDIDEGVTPFMMKCRADPGCGGESYSAMYRNVPNIKPHYLWRKPTPDEYKASSKDTKNHFDQGGLDLHPWEER